MVLCGFWHGANWNFLAWGLINGVYLGLEHLLRFVRLPFRIPNLIKRLLTFHLWSLAVVFFAAHDIQNALDVLSNLFCGNGYESSNLTDFYYPMVLTVIFFILHPFDSIPLIKEGRRPPESLVDDHRDYFSLARCNYPQFIQRGQCPIYLF